jgi:hypothetical protein
MSIDGCVPSNMQSLRCFHIIHGVSKVGRRGPFALSGLDPPLGEGCLVVWGCACHLEPGEDLTPNLSGEWARKHQVQHCLGGLSAEEACWVVLQSLASKTTSCPSAVLFR